MVLILKFCEFPACGLKYTISKRASGNATAAETVAGANNDNMCQETLLHHQHPHKDFLLEKTSV